MVGLDNLGIAFAEFTGDDGIVTVILFFFTNFGLIEAESRFPKEISLKYHVSLKKH